MRLKMSLSVFQPNVPEIKSGNFTIVIIIFGWMNNNEVRLRFKDQCYDVVNCDIDAEVVQFNTNATITE